MGLKGKGHIKSPCTSSRITRPSSGGGGASHDATARLFIIGACKVYSGAYATQKNATNLYEMHPKELSVHTFTHEQAENSFFKSQN